MGHRGLAQVCVDANQVQRRSQQLMFTSSSPLQSKEVGDIEGLQRHFRWPTVDLILVHTTVPTTMQGPCLSFSSGTVSSSMLMGESSPPWSTLQCLP